MNQNKHSHINEHQKCNSPARKKWAFWGMGIGSIVWLFLRSGTKPRRLAYPCQRVALANSVGFLGYLASILGATHLYRRLKRHTTLVSAGLFIIALILVSVLTASNVPATPVYADLSLPGWTSPTAISNVFVVPNVPTPECSLDGGTLPATAPCNAASYALHDAGVDSLINEMENQGDYFYKTSSHPTGVVGANDVVVIKINNQWAENGGGRLVTNSDALKGLMWRILQHPETFTGAIVVAENTQDVVWDWDHTPANAQDQNQSYQDVINAFQSLGHPVSLYRWDDLNDDRISGGSVDDSGYPTGEYDSGNTTDTYILLEDSDTTATNELSYPKFQATSGISISMRYGVWDGSSYDTDRLTFINMPVLKQHGMAGATIAWKNLIGFLTIADNTARFGNWDTMHGYFWGYSELGDTEYGLLGRQMAHIRTPDLNVVDAIWVADNNYNGTATRQDILLASTDPFAVDWYASEYILYALYADQSGSAARNGTFRSATRVNQNAAAAEWSGTYPYIDLLDSYNGDTPSNHEKNQMNVYIAGGSTTCEAITSASITGPVTGTMILPYTFTVATMPVTASTPITYTWLPAPDTGQSTDTASYSWTMSGTQTVTVTAENCGGSETATHTITIAEPAACAYPLESVSISGNTSGYTGTLYTFAAQISPANASTPVTYTWEPAPDAGQSTDTASYTWAVTGTQTITVTAENCEGNDTSAHTIDIVARSTYRLYLPLILRNYTPAGPVCAIPLTNVTISGPSSGMTSTMYTFTASPTPSNATTPIAYTWNPAPNIGQGTNSAAYQWDTTGDKTLNVTASNCSAAHSAEDTYTITIQALPSGDLVQPGDLTYVGAFRLPDVGERPLTFEYGGNAMTFNPDGHVTNTDAFSGSLFTMGHDRLAYGEMPDGNQVTELSIPEPVVSSNLNDLNYAEFLQDFTDVMTGHFTVYEEIVRMGMSYLNHPDSGPKIHLGFGWHLPPETPVPTHGWVNATLEDPNFQGEWHIGTQDFNSVNGYMFNIPTAWADTHTHSRYLATGRFRDGGWGSMGPTIFAYTPWLAGGAAPISGTHLTETALLRYESSTNTSDIERALNDYQHPDEWEGGAWVTTPSGKSAVMFVGTKGTGAKYWYGWVNPAGPEHPCVEVELVGTFTLCRLADGTPCPAEDLTGCTGHNDYRGWWSSSFNAQFIFYNPADLAQVAAGTMDPWEPQPYASMNVDDVLYLSPPAGDSGNLGTGVQRRFRIGAAAYDPTNGYLYVLEQFADEATPVVHVWQIQ